MSFSNFEFPNTNFYNSDLRELIAMYKKMVRDYNSIIESIEDLENKYKELDENIDTVIQEKVASTVELLISRVDKLDNDCKALKKYVDTELADTIKYVDSRIDENRQYTDTSLKTMRELLERELGVLDYKIRELRIYTDTIVTSIDRDISKQIEELKEFVYTFTVDQVSVINPITHKRETIQKTIDDIADKLHIWSLKVRQYDALTIKVSEYDDMKLTVFDFEYLGLWWLQEKRELVKLYKNSSRWLNEQLMMNSPFTGIRENVKEVVLEICKYLQGSSLTVTEWDTLGLTVDKYEALNLTVYEHDWRSHMIVAADRYHGLTVDDYVRLGIDRNNHVVYN